MIPNLSKAAAAMLLAVMTTPALAADVSLTYSVASYHWCRDCGYNETNPGVGIEVALGSEWYVGAGAYHNSFAETTGYVSVGYEHRLARYLTAGVEAGHLWGYDETDWMAAPTLSIGTDRLNVKALIVPTVVIGFQIRAGFDL